MVKKKNKKKFRKITIKAQVLEPEEKIEKLVSDTKDYYNYMGDRLKNQSRSTKDMIDKTKSQKQLFGIM
jgi:hypothetical protein